MIYFDGRSRDVEWNAVKSRRLKETRGKSFGDILAMNCLRRVKHPNRPHQALILFEDLGRIWAVPCVVTDDKIFFKTLYVSRKYTAMFERGEL